MRLILILLLCFLNFSFSNSLLADSKNPESAKTNIDRTDTTGVISVKGFAEREISRAIAIVDIENDAKVKAAFKTLIQEAFDLDRISTFALGKANCAILKNSGKYEEFKQIIANMLVVLNCASFKSYRKSKFSIGKVSDTVAKDKEGKEVHIYEVDSTIQPIGKPSMIISWTIRGYDGNVYKVFDAKVDKQVSMKTTLKHKINDMMQKYKVSDMDSLSKQNPKMLADRLNGFMTGLRQEYK